MQPDDVAPADSLHAWYPPAAGVASAKAGDLRETIASRRGIARHHLAIAESRSSLWDALLPHVVDSGDVAVVLDPCDRSQVDALESHGARVERHALSARDDFRVDLQELVRCASGARAVVLANPNVPTGRPVAQGFIRELAKRVDEDTWVVIDETFVDYLRPPASVETWVDRHPKLVVLKAMSPCFALPAEAAYLTASHELITALEATLRPPNTRAQACASAALGDANHYIRKIKETHFARDDMIDELTELDTIRVFDSRTGFFLVELATTTAPRAVRELTRRGGSVRHCSDTGHVLGDAFLRIRVGTAKANARVVAALRDCIAPNR